MIRSGRRPISARANRAASNDSAVTARHPQERRSPPVASRTRGSSSITTTIFPADEAWVALIIKFLLVLQTQYAQPFSEINRSNVSRLGGAARHSETLV